MRYSTSCGRSSTLNQNVMFAGSSSFSLWKAGESAVFYDEKGVILCGGVIQKREDVK